MVRFVDQMSTLIKLINRDGHYILIIILDKKRQHSTYRRVVRVVYFTQENDSPSFRMATVGYQAMTTSYSMKVDEKEVWRALRFM